MRALLIRGMLAGLIAGLLVFGFAKVFGEPSVDRAIGFETAMDEAKTHAGMAMDHEPELVSRPTQAGLGLFTAVIVYATAFGGLFALVFAVANGRAVRLHPRAVSALLAAAGFVSVYLVPNLKYPANPPAIGEPETIGTRTALYFIMLAISVAAMVIAAALRNRLATRLGAWNAALVAGAAYLALAATAATLLPGVDEVPAEFPATVLWQFRVASFGMQLTLWSALGLLFGPLAQRALDPRPTRAAFGV